MFSKKTDEPSGLDQAIESVLHEMSSLNADSDEYAKMVDQLDKLYKMKTYTKETSVSPEAMIAVVGNLAGIVLILGFERAHVITSKALGFVMKSRV